MVPSARTVCRPSAGLHPNIVDRAASVDARLGARRCPRQTTLGRSTSRLERSRRVGRGNSSKPSSTRRRPADMSTYCRPRQGFPPMSSHPRSYRAAFLAVLGALACTEQSSLILAPSGPDAGPRPATSASVDERQSAAQTLARDIALAMNDAAIRAHVRNAMRESRATDHKLILVVSTGQCNSGC